MAISNPVTLLKTPRRRRLRVISAKKRSTWFNQEHEGGCEVQVEPRKALQPPHHFRVLVRGVVVDDQMQAQPGRGPGIDGAQEADELLVPVPGHAAS